LKLAGNVHNNSTYRPVNEFMCSFNYQAYNLEYGTFIWENLRGSHRHHFHYFSNTNYISYIVCSR